MSIGVSIGRRLRHIIPAIRRPSGRRAWVLLLGLSLLALAAHQGYQRFAAASPSAPALQTARVQMGSLVSTVTTMGSVVITRQAKLSFPAAGRLTELNVVVGSSVKAGQPLARVDPEPLQSKLISAESSLKVAQIKLQQLKDGATPEEVASARASYDSALARHQELLAGPTEADRLAARSAVDQASSSLASAQFKLEQLEAGPTQTDLASAQAAVASAQANLASAEAKLEQVKAGATIVELATAQATVESTRSALASAQTKLDQLRAGPTSTELASAQASVEQAKQSLISAEDRYEMVKAGKLSEAGGTSGSAVQQAYYVAKANYESAVQKLQQLQEGPTAADLQSAESGVVSARASHDSAVDKLEQLRRGATDPDMASAQSAVEQARATLASAGTKLSELQAGPTEVDLGLARSAVQQARASLAGAQTKLSELLAGPKTADVSSAKASLASAEAQLASKTTIKESDLILQEEQVRQAEATLQQARLDLAAATITAPFDGVVSAVAGNVGEQVGSGTTVVTMVDPAAFRIDVTVDETDVAKLVAGQPTVVTFDAMPDQQLRGRVTAVAPTGTTQQGVVSYLVTVGVEPAQRPASSAGESSPRFVLPGGQAPAQEQPGAMREQPRDRAGTGQGQMPGGRAIPEGTTGQRAPSGGESAARTASAGVDTPVRYPAAGMTASVSIETQRKDAVLLAPNRAVRTQGRNRIVEVLVGEKTETRTVQIGSSNDQMTEIVSGLQEGDQVVIPTTTIRSTTGNVPPGGAVVPGMQQPGFRMK